MTTHIPDTLCQIIITRAGGRCEYCGKSQVSFFPHEIDHVIAQKHGGKTIPNNLALACFECNRYKGSDIASFDPDNPCTQRWAGHFRYENGVVVPLTSEGRVTVFYCA